MASLHRPHALGHGQAVHLFHSEVLFVQGMPVTSIFLVVRGTLLNFSADGAQLKRWVGPQQIVGINDALVGGTWQSLGIAHGPLDMVAFSFESLQAALGKIPGGHRALLNELIGAPVVQQS